MDVIDRAKAAMEGVTPGPWIFDDHEEGDYDTITVGAGSFLEDPGWYKSVDLIHEVDTYSDELDGVNYAQKVRDAKFIAEARTLMPALIAEVERLRA